MSDVFSTWVFQSPEDITDKWVSFISRLESTLSCESVRTAKGEGGFHFSLNGDRRPYLSGVCIDPTSNLWVLESTSILASAYHWILRYCGAQCVPDMRRAATCGTSMHAAEVISSSIIVPNEMEIVAATPTHDVAILRAVDSGMLGKAVCKIEMWAMIEPDVYIVFADSNMSHRGKTIARSNMRVLHDFVSCNDTPCSIKFSDIWKFR